MTVLLSDDVVVVITGSETDRSAMEKSPESCSLAVIFNVPDSAGILSMRMTAKPPICLNTILPSSILPTNGMLVLFVG